MPNPISGNPVQPVNFPTDEQSGAGATANPLRSHMSSISNSAVSILSHNTNDLSSLLGEVKYPPELKNGGFQSNEPHLSRSGEGNDHSPLLYKSFTQEFSTRLKGGITRDMAHELIDKYALDQRTKDKISSYIETVDKWNKDQNKKLNKMLNKK